MPDDVLQTPLQFLKGVGPRKAADLKKAGLTTVDDLLFRFPMRYEDRSRMQPIIGLRPGQTAAIAGEVLHCHLQQTRRANFRLFTALVQDASGQIQVVWPNQAFLKDVIRPHQQIVLFGKVELWGTRGLQITDPEFEIVEALPEPSPGAPEPSGPASPGQGPLHTGRIVPVYERTGSVTTNMQRRFVSQALEQLPEVLFDPVPADVLTAHDWPSRRAALLQAHFPSSDTPIEALNRFETPAQRRLIFEDFFVFQAGLALRRHENAQVRKAHVCTVTDEVRAAARAVLPFKLTPGQRDALAEIVADLQRAWPMQRLLQGDVGAGKTIVAVLAAVVAMENGYQVAFMAPTEILAEQHFRTVMKWLDGTKYRVRLLTGRVTAAQRRELLPAIERGDIPFVIGTHALVQQHVSFRNLALVIIDEQHRFGVVQRGLLAAKGGYPDVLVMTATPIPRTLALTECGDMDVSVIRGLPPGRKPMTTIVKPDSRRDEVYALIRAEVARGRQAYVVYPLVEESEKVDLQAATAMAAELQGRLPRVRGGAAPRPHEGRREGRRDARLRRGNAARAGGHVSGRSRRRRAERHRDGGRARGTVRPVAAAPAARPHRPRRARVDLRPGLSGAVVRRCAGALEGDGGHQRRLRHRGEGPADSRPGRLLRHASIGPAAAARRRSGAGRRSARAGVQRSAGARRAGTPHAGAAGVRPDRLGAPVRLDCRRLNESCESSPVPIRAAP